MISTSFTQTPELDLSVVIIAHNEEANLARCLLSLPPGCEIIVVDSGSLDQTVTIAKKYGARVFERAFTHFSEQKNYAQDQAKRTWILSLDADEVLSQELGKWLSSICLAPQQALPSAYRLRRRLVFMGRKMRWGKTQDAPIRLFLRGQARFEGSIHESLNVGQARVQRNPVGQIWHYSYSNLSDYFQRFNSYTSAVAEQHIAKGNRPQFLGHIVRPWYEFFQRYFLWLGFLDGYPGYTYALNSSLYSYIKYAKIFEQLREDSNHQSEV